MTRRENLIVGRNKETIAFIRAKFPEFKHSRVIPQATEKEISDNIVAGNISEELARRCHLVVTIEIHNKDFATLASQRELSFGELDRADVWFRAWKFVDGQLVAHKMRYTEPATKVQSSDDPNHYGNFKGVLWVGGREIEPTLEDRPQRNVGWFFQE